MAYGFFLLAGFPYGDFLEHQAGNVLPWPVEMSVRLRPFGLIGEATLYPPMLPPLPVKELRLTPAPWGYALEGHLLGGHVRGRGSSREMVLAFKDVEVGAWLPSVQGPLSGEMRLDRQGVRFALLFRGKVALEGMPLRFQSVAVKGRWQERGELTLLLEKGDLQGRMDLHLSPTGSLKGEGTIQATAQAPPMVRALFPGREALAVGGSLAAPRLVPVDAP
ncbi:MAG: hypothetical protein D6819_03950 [Gammaproteobacteria bacterium]|nr:MAG: hypothetical protein D6819_03950 [Gammaproteobacteria bacterium]